MTELVTAQELEVIRLLAEGHKDATVARRLQTSPMTVRRRVKSFQTKVGARNRTQAVAIAAAMGLVRLAERPDVAADERLLSQE